MTDRERSELDRAIDRASRAGLEVVAHGHRKCDGVPIYCVPSQTEHNRWHVVTLLGHRLMCDCKAAEHGRICCHRAAVHVELAAQAVKREQLAREVEEAMRAEEAEHRQWSRECPKLADDCRPVGLFR